MSTAAIFGAMGFSLALFSNSARKLPLMRQPWEHVICAGVGYWFGTHYEEFRQMNKERYEKVLAQRKANDEARAIKLARRAAEQS